MHFPVIRQSLRFVAELLQLYHMLTLVTLGSPQRRSRLLFHCCHRRPSLLSLSIAAVAVHRCRHRPMHFAVIRQSLRLVAELLQLYQMFALVVLSLPLPSNALPSHSAIPKVRSRTSTIVSDAHGSYSRFPAAALAFVVPLLPSPSIAAITVHRCHRHPTHFPVIRQSLRLVAELLQLYQTLTAVTLGSPQRRSSSLFHHCCRHPMHFPVTPQSLRLVMELLQFKLPGSQLCRMTHLPICQVCNKPFKASGWLKVYYQKEHPEFLDMDDNRDGDTSPNPYEHHIAGRPPFYNRDDPVLPNFLEDGDPVIVTRDGDMRFSRPTRSDVHLLEMQFPLPKLPTRTCTWDYLSTMFRIRQN